jgi:hypothetical protein
LISAAPNFPGSVSSEMVVPLGGVLPTWSRVARGRFELPSAGDSSLHSRRIQSPLGTWLTSGPNVHAMLDHYTTGLREVIRLQLVNNRFRVARTEVTYILVESLIYILRPPVSLSSDAASYRGYDPFIGGWEGSWREYNDNAIRSRGKSA